MRVNWYFKKRLEKEELSLIHPKKLCDQGWKLYSFVCCSFWFEKGKVRVSSEQNPLSSLHKQVDLQHTKISNCMNLQAYLPLIWEGVEGLYRDLLTRKVQWISRKKFIQESYRLKVLMGTLLFKQTVTANFIDLFREKLAAPPNLKRRTGKFQILLMIKCLKDHHILSWMSFEYFPGQKQWDGNKCF